MTKKKNSKAKTAVAFAWAVVIGVIIGIIITQWALSSHPYEDQESQIVTINGTKYNQTTASYYNIEYRMTEDYITFTIRNPCLEIVQSTGKSMEPFFEDENLVIVDTCYNTNKLKVGDVVVWRKEFSNDRVQHRIVLIDQEDGWLRTKGDSNDIMDDFKGMEYVYGKCIGVLNVLMEKKVISEEIIKETD